MNFALNAVFKCKLGHRIDTIRFITIYTKVDYFHKKNYRDVTKTNNIFTKLIKNLYKINVLILNLLHSNERFLTFDGNIIIQIKSIII